MNSYAIIPIVLLSIIHGISTENELINAIKSGELAKAARLIHYNRVDDQLHGYNENGENPLCLALYRNYEQLSLMMIHHGADVRGTTISFGDSIVNGSPPLHLAVRNNLISCVTAILEAGAYVHKKDYAGCSPLMLIVKDSSGRYNAHIARILLRAGADVNETEYHYDELPHPPHPLHYAARNWNAPVAELLLWKGALVNEIGGDGTPMAPIDYVMIYNNEVRSSWKAMDTAVILLNNGADQTEWNDFPKILRAFWTPAHFKSVPGAYEDFNDFLLKVTAKAAEVSKLASVKGYEETFSLMKYVRKEMIQIGMFFNHKNSISWKIIETAQEYDKQGMFALYRLLKACYDASGHGTKSSALEGVKLNIFDYVSNEIAKRTYFEKIPVNLLADVLYEAGYYGWKIERMSWNVALAVYPYRNNLHAKRVGGEIARILLLESENEL